ncbi:MAG: helix-turn-helix transcriptional regulator [Legionellales bacterium]|nr:helix-turn-helix transcriptional regulator [Legionellales bacterium]
MGSRFEEDFMRGYNEKNVKIFDSHCKNSSGVVGSATQSGVIEVNSKGHAKLAANRPDVGWNCLEHRIWEHTKAFSYLKNFTGEEYSMDAANYYYDPDSNGFKLQIFALMLRWQIDKDTQRICWFAGDTPEFNTKLINNIFLVKLYLRGFMKEVDSIIKDASDNTIKMIDFKENFFIENNGMGGTDIEKINNLLKDEKLIDSQKKVTSREWDCLQLYTYGKSAKETGEILQISRRTVENHFYALMEKFKIDNKADILLAIENVLNKKI